MTDLVMALSESVVIRTERLTKSFGRLTAVCDLSLEVRRGEVLGFLGPNGAGKTTAIGMMCGLLRPSSGQTFIHGRPVRRGDAVILRGLGFVPQDIVVWPKLTCLEQLEFIGEAYGLPRPEARRRGRKLLSTVGLEAQIDKLAQTLSGGMRRRLNLVLALVHDPEILILDEPEAGLDPQGRVMVRDLLRSLADRREKTIVLATHNMDEADRLADRVAIIDRGRLLTLDSPNNLKRHVGEGDVLQIELADAMAAGDPTAPACAAAAALASARAILPPGVEPSAEGGSLIVRAKEVLKLAPVILGAIAAAGFRPGEVRLRGNTLEDVFIALTGRSLRE